MTEDLRVDMIATPDAEQLPGWMSQPYDHKTATEMTEGHIRHLRERAGFVVHPEQLDRMLDWRGDLIDPTMPLLRAFTATRVRDYPDCPKYSVYPPPRVASREPHYWHDRLVRTHDQQHVDLLWWAAMKLRR